MSILQECEQLLAEAAGNTLRMKEVTRIAHLLRDAGIQLSYHNIADYGNLSDEQVEKVFLWNLSQKKNARLDFNVGDQVTAKGDYSKLLAAILYLQTHRKQGMPFLAAKSGLSEDRIKELIAAHGKSIKKEFSGFNPLWTKGATPDA
ncbi:hypothetical protein D3C85_1290190 [compost metagenome]